MPRVYIETTIPSFYFDTRPEVEVVSWRNSTRRWWDLYRHAYELVTSEFVLAELRRAPTTKARAAAELLRQVRVLPTVPQAREVAAYYIDHLLMPKDAAGDAAHLAMASVHGVEFLLTWNCRHLANANKAQHLRVLNVRLGLAVPTLTTPLSLIPESEQ